MTLLRADHLSKAFGKKSVVTDISLQITSGSFIGLLGPNGAGKSTIISMLIGTSIPDSGQIQLDGNRPDSPTYHRRIGVVFQESVLDGQLTIRQNLLLRASMYHDLSASRVNDVLAQFQLLELADQKYKTLSGGQRRRVDIARAILHKPDLLFLDEPSTGLDIQTRQTIWRILAKLRRDQHLTVILTTHYLEEAENADFVYVIDHGRIIAADTIPALKAAYAPTRLNLTTRNPDSLRTALPPDWPIAETETGLSAAIPDALTCIPVLNSIQSQITAFEVRSGTVDDIFLTLTGKEIH